MLLNKLPKKNGEAYSTKSRVKELYSALGLQDDYQSSTLDFLSLWRNLVAHKQNNRKENLNNATQKSLIAQKQDFKEKYAHIDIEDAIQHYIKKQIPKSKEVVFLLAIATNICREIDEAIIGKVAGTKEQMVIFTEKLLAIYFNENPTIFNNWQGSKKKENLIKILQQAGLMKVEIQQAESSKVKKKKKSIPKRNISCALPDEYLKNISSLSRNNIIERLKIKTK